MNRSRSAALVVVVATAVSVFGVGTARARSGTAGGGASSAVLDPCTSIPVALPRCNLLVLTDQRAWHGNQTATNPLPPLTLPNLPPLTLPNLLSPGTTTTAPTTTTTTAPTTTTTTTPPILGFGPGDLQSAYGVTSSSGSTDTIAVIEGGGAPNAESDLQVYRSHFGLPECSTANSCLQIVDKNGGNTQPPADDIWALETVTDLDMASAMCPTCKLLLVQAADDVTDFGTANVTAAGLGATVINNSWGYPEATDPGTNNDVPYTHAHAVTVASSGDTGYYSDSQYPDGMERFPASSPNVVAVGGTSLSRDTSLRGWAETAWNKSESGCSTIYPKPGWQASLPCSFGRATADVAAVADLGTGVAVYDSRGYAGSQGWMVVGGTSVSSAIVSGVFGAAGNAANVGSNAPSELYTHGAGFNDITVGSTGNCGDARCNAGPGWDGPTGNGTPAGVTAF